MHDTVTPTIDGHKPWPFKFIKCPRAKLVLLLYLTSIHCLDTQRPNFTPWAITICSATGGT
jgi:hypothetical protein